MLRLAGFAEQDRRVRRGTARTFGGCVRRALRLRCCCCCCRRRRRRRCRVAGDLRRERAAHRIGGLRSSARSPCLLGLIRRASNQKCEKDGGGSCHGTLVVQWTGLPPGRHTLLPAFTLMTTMRALLLLAIASPLLAQRYTAPDGKLR